MRAEKTLLLDEIVAKIRDSKGMVITSYKQLNPNLASTFRMNIGKTGGSLEVVKKRLLVQAAKEMGMVIDRNTMLKGHVAVVFADADPVQTTKCVYQFCKDNDEVLSVLGGRFEGTLCSAKDVELISKLPGRDEMRSQLLGLFEAPMSQTLSVMESMLCSVMFCLENKAAKDSE